MQILQHIIYLIKQSKLETWGTPLNGLNREVNSAVRGTFSVKIVCIKKGMDCTLWWNLSIVDFVEYPPSPYLGLETIPGGVGYLTKFNTGEVLPRGPTPYPFIYHFGRKSTPFIYLLL